ncbi:hypothetical protein BU24DRAFT_418099 [Aaosphaeria arxii CBS 175.79]|uniref:Xylanolytic transcriptional activator regulatory domain-containing protein n=1 Tax=Aaosphaeria arxii CBS 175.79 TaxID=1450172 RepID=A0A6A5XZ30_9PLEO|nr:uncharacterized protein BU24DRAFT_418099 [Aaosphaeria arxii CBS 175.79]KAF2018575.1 hypothetical protein BU24DRAFT_418099 [Aaosphaeria arxii CBS 175.79]
MLQYRMFPVYYLFSRSYIGLCDSFAIHAELCFRTIPLTLDSKLDEDNLTALSSESKIDGIGDQLARIEQALQQVQMASPHLSGLNHRMRTPYSVSASLMPSPESQTANFEGETSLNTCSTQAADQVQAALGNTQILQEDPDLATALKSLSQVILAQNEHPDTHPPASAERAVTDRPKYSLPPAEVVSRVLRACEGFYDTTIAMDYPVRPYQEIVSLCKELYFNMNDVPVASLTVAFGSLYFIFGYYEFVSDDDGDELDSYTDMFLRNMLDLLNILPILLSPSIDSLEALLLGACYAIESSKPSMCSALLSQATHLCLSLGYHRSTSMTYDSPKTRGRKINLFWFLYYMDKGLCLRLGRASFIQDYDIAVPWPSFGDEEIYRASNEFCKFSCKLAGLQGRVYEELYSPFALRKPTSSRTAYAEALASDIRQISTEREQVGFIAGMSEYANECALLSDKVTISATLTLVLRAIPSNDGNLLSAACIAAARQSLHLHQTCTAKIMGIADKHAFAEYLHWALLHTPCIPYLVIFCHIVETQSFSDLAILGDFVKTLQPARGISSAIGKLYLICDVFYRVAKLYIKAMTRQLDASGSGIPAQSMQTLQQLRTELNPFMTRMGMNNVLDASFNHASNIDSCSTLAPPDISFDKTNFFIPNSGPAEWFTEEQVITSLLGNDFNFMDPDLVVTTQK